MPFNDQGTGPFKTFGLCHKKGGRLTCPLVCPSTLAERVRVDTLELDALLGGGVTSLNRGHFSGSVDGESCGNDRGEKKEFHGVEKRKEGKGPQASGEQGADCFGCVLVEDCVICEALNQEAKTLDLLARFAHVNDCETGAEGLELK